MFGGYWERPEESAQVVLEDGWIRTGDVVVMDDDGFISIVDRIKELIITGGFNVYPSEVEQALRQVPGVADAAVVGLPSEGGDEEVVAAVVLERGAAFDEDAIRIVLQGAARGLQGAPTGRRDEGASRVDDRQGGASPGAGPAPGAALVGGGHAKVS